MKLLFIYGPPAAGKLTVAEELAAATGLKLFHNHASIDVVEPIFGFGTSAFHRLVNKIRLDVIEEAAKENIDGLIFTFVYSHPHDKNFVDEVTGRVEKHGGEVCFVQLVCAPAILETRVVSPSRRKHGKLASAETLREVMDKHDLFTPIADSNSFSIDTLALGPREAARKIVERYGL
jgi:hypothetical protein